MVVDGITGIMATDLQHNAGNHIVGAMYNYNHPRIACGKKIAEWSRAGIQFDKINDRTAV